MPNSGLYLYIYIIRLVYIRGTPEQNIHALQIIIGKVGGWPYTTPVYDNELARIEEKTSMFIPFLAIPPVLFQIFTEFHGNLFPLELEEPPQIAGTFCVCLFKTVLAFSLLV